MSPRTKSSSGTQFNWRNALLLHRGAAFMRNGSFCSPPLCSSINPGSDGCAGSGSAWGGRSSLRRSTITRRATVQPCSCHSCSTPSQPCPALRHSALSPCRASLQIICPTRCVCRSLNYWASPRCSQPAIMSSLPWAISPRTSVDQSWRSRDSSHPHNVGCA